MFPTTERSLSPRQTQVTVMAIPPRITQSITPLHGHALQEGQELCTGPHMGMEHEAATQPLT